jgi:1-acyl-sn-glycerol-3-phosphate acyltransferase
VTVRRDDLAPTARTSAAAHGRNLASLALRAWRLTVTGADHVPAVGPVILAANHSAYLDGLALAAASPRPAHLLVAADIFVPPFARVLRATGQIRMQSEVADRAALGLARQVLDDGGVVGIFPETVRGSGDVVHVDHGVAYLAARTGAVVVPVAILGTRNPGSGRDSLPRIRSRIDVVFGAPGDVRVEGDARRRVVIARSGERLRQLLADHVHAACARTGQTLPGPLPDTDTLHRSNS